MGRLEDGEHTGHDADNGADCELQQLVDGAAEVEVDPGADAGTGTAAEAGAAEQLEGLLDGAEDVAQDLLQLLYHQRGVEALAERDAVVDAEGVGLVCGRGMGVSCLTEWAGW